MDYTEYKYLPDGTYQVSPLTGEVRDYGVKWAYGYIVGVKPLDRPLRFGELFGVWSHEGEVYVDIVEHISDRGSALRIAAERGETAIYDLRERKVIFI